MKIAWIDDDIEIIEPVIKPLVQDDHKITRIRTIQEALEEIEFLRTCDLILLDMILPLGDCDEDFGYYSGALLLRKLREEYEVTTPVIIFSVVVPNRIKEQLDSLNVAEYVLKPALPTELKEAVDAVLAAQGNSGDGE
jgi:DNA-binding response OmpR family regulator